MKKIISSFAVLFFTVSLILAQSVNTGEQPIKTKSDWTISNILSSITDQHSNTWNIGSAKKLEGKIYVLEVFVTEPGSAWTSTEISVSHSKAAQACEWLKKQAAKYGKSIEFEYGQYTGNNNKGIVLPNLPHNYQQSSDFPLVLPRALKAIGYSDSLQSYTSIKKFSNFDNMITLVFINNEGWDCSTRYTKRCAGWSELDDYFVEYCSLFKEDDKQGEPLTAQTIAHEVLHLFGAWDMYKGQASYEAEAFAKKYYPHSIMLTSHKDFDDLEIDPLNAWLTGLSNEYEDWFMKFIRLESPVSPR